MLARIHQYSRIGRGSLARAPRSPKRCVPIGAKVLVLTCLGLALNLMTNHSVVHAQTSASEAPAPLPSNSLENLSPRRSMQIFLKAVGMGDFDVAKLFVADVDHPVKNRDSKDLLKKVAMVIDRRLQISTFDLSAKPEGEANDGIPSGKQILAIPKIHGERVRIMLERIELKDHPSYQKIWRLSPSAVEGLMQLSSGSGFEIESYVPPALKRKVFELALWQWLGILLGVVIAVGVSLLARKLINLILIKSLQRYEEALPAESFGEWTKPLQGLLALLLFSSLAPLLNLNLDARESIALIQRVLLIFFTIWLLRLIVVALFSQLRLRLTREEKIGAVALLPSAKAVVQAVIITFGVLFFIQNLGYDVTTLVAGLGVGGIAVAFAAQKTIENLISGFMILMDQPVKVGDYCRYASGEGTVERIGLRSIRIRTLERTLVTIPNAEFSQYNIENLAERDQIRLHLVLGVRYETSSDQMRYILAELNKLLIVHERVVDETIRVRFVSFADFSLNIEVVGYINTSAFPEFLSIREDLYLSILDIVKQAGSDFAFPSQTIYVEQSSGINQHRAKEVETIVKEWKEKSQVPLPNFPEDFRKQISNTRSFPPRESWIDMGNID